MHRPLHSGPKKCTNLVATTWFPIILLWDKPVSEGLLMTVEGQKGFSHHYRQWQFSARSRGQFPKQLGKGEQWDFLLHIFMPCLAACYTQLVFHHELLWTCMLIALVRKHSWKLVKSSSIKHVISSSPPWEPKHPAVQQTYWQNCNLHIPYKYHPNYMQSSRNHLILTPIAQSWRPLGPTPVK